MRWTVLGASVALSWVALACNKAPTATSGQTMLEASPPQESVYELIVEVDDADHPLRQLLPEKVDGSFILLADASGTPKLREKAQAPLGLGKLGIDPVDAPVRVDATPPRVPVRDLTLEDVTVGPLQRADLDSIDPTQIRVADHLGKESVSPAAIVKGELATFRGMEFESKAALKNVLTQGLDAPVIFNLKQDARVKEGTLINTIQGHQDSPAYSASIFISTSRSKAVVERKFFQQSAGSDSRTVMFAIDVPAGRGIDVPIANRKAGNEQLLDADEQEVMIVGNLESSHIIGYWQKKNGTTGKFHINPQASKAARQRFLQQYPEVRSQLSWWDRITN